MSLTWRLGLVYLGLLLLLLGLGHKNQAERQALRGLEARLQAWKLEEEELLKSKGERSKPLSRLEWAEKEGFIPMSRGRWP